MIVTFFTTLPLAMTNMRMQKSYLFDRGICMWPVPIKKSTGKFFCRFSSAQILLAPIVQTLVGDDFLSLSLSECNVIDRQNYNFSN